MKKTILSILTLALCAFTLSAQRDVKTLNKISDSKLRSIMGTPKEYSDEMEDYYYYFNDATVVTSKNNRSLVSFQTSSSKYCILTKYISGGVKVGDPISKLQKVDFAKTAYGRNKSANGLTAYTPKHQNDYNYVVFQDEFQSVYFEIQNGIIKGWMLSSKLDTPYANYDYSISFW